jgi:DNA-binding transcriptional regulator YiaG
MTIHAESTARKGRAFNSLPARIKKRRPSVRHSVVETKPAESTSLGPGDSIRDSWMTSNEFCAILALLRISRSAFARSLNCPPRTVRHWTLDRPVPVGIGVLARLAPSAFRILKYATKTIIGCPESATGRVESREYASTERCIENVGRASLATAHAVTRPTSTECAPCNSRRHSCAIA